MATAGATPPRLTDDQLSDIMALIGGSDSVELKLSINDADRRATIDALGLDPLQCQIRQVFFFDTPDLKLSESGVVVRARRVQGRGDDSTVKLRPIRPEDLTPELRATPGFKVEVDAMPGQYVCSASMSAALGKDDVRPVAGKARPIRKLFSKAQRAFYDAHAPGGIALDDLSILGPIFVLKTKFTPERFAPPDGRRVLAVSRTPPPCSSCRPSACRTRPSRPPPKPGHRSCSMASRSRARRTPRRGRPSTSTRTVCSPKRPRPPGGRGLPHRGRGRESLRDDGGPTSSPGSPGPRPPLAADRPDRSRRPAGLARSLRGPNGRALDAYEALPAEANRLYTTYIDLRAAALQDAHDPMGPGHHTGRRCPCPTVRTDCSSSLTAT